MLLVASERIPNWKYLKQNLKKVNRGEGGEEISWIKLEKEVLNYCQDMPLQLLA